MIFNQRCVARARTLEANLMAASKCCLSAQFLPADPLYISFYVVTFKRHLGGGREKGLKNWPQVTTHVCANSKKRKNIFFFFLISSVFSFSRAMDGWIIHDKIYARNFLFFPHMPKFHRFYKNQSQKKKPTVLCGGFVVYCFGHTHTRERERRRMTIVCHGKKKKTWKTRQSKFVVRSF